MGPKSGGLTVEEVRGSEKGTPEEHREINSWMRREFNQEKEILLQIHCVLVDILEVLSPPSKNGKVGK